MDNIKKIYFENSKIINLVLFFLILLLVFPKRQENFELTTEQLVAAINEIYKADVEAIRNLSNVAKQLNNTTTGLTIPGNLSVKDIFKSREIYNVSVTDPNRSTAMNHQEIIFAHTGKAHWGIINDDSGNFVIQNVSTNGALGIRGSPVMYIDKNDNSMNVNYKLNIKNYTLEIENDELVIKKGTTVISRFSDKLAISSAISEKSKLLKVFHFIPATQLPSKGGDKWYIANPSLYVYLPTTHIVKPLIGTVDIGITGGGTGTDELQQWTYIQTSTSPNFTENNVDLNILYRKCPRQHHYADSFYTAGQYEIPGGRWVRVYIKVNINTDDQPYLRVHELFCNFTPIS
jgi:hypothetical protein